MSITPVIRAARLDDAARLSEIYAPYILETAVSFEYVPLTPEQFRERMRQMMDYPYLVAEVEGVVVGYAYVHQLGTREAYRYSVELSIYLDRSMRSQGIGRALYMRMEEALRTQGVINVYADIARASSPDDPYLTDASLRFHAAMGFTENGVFTRCGRKFSRWYDTVWMEKFIGEHSHEPGELLSCAEVYKRLGIS